MAQRRSGQLVALALAATLAACGPVMTGPSRAPAPERPAAEAVGGFYTVVAGDTIYVVARKFGVTVRALIDANGLEPPFQLQPGQILRLPTGGDYVVVKGDTLAKIARKTGVEFATLARMNGLSPPYRIRVGQRLMLPTGTSPPPTEVITAAGETTVIQSPNAGQPPAAGAGAPVTVETLPTAERPPRETTTFGAATRPGLVPGAEVTPVAPTGSAPAPAVSPTPPPPPAIKPPPASGAAGTGDATPSPAASSSAAASPPAEAPRLEAAAATPAPPPARPSDAPAFIWPVKGTLLSPFGTMAKGQHNDGINIAVPKGTPVLAAADGDVVYVGNELRGYGNLLLIKHTGTDYITAYAQNAKLLVKKGQHVRRGQEIAVSGDSGGVAQPQLHFEVRQGVKPIDPQSVLPEISPAASPGARPGPG